MAAITSRIRARARRPEGNGHVSNDAPLLRCSSVDVAYGPVQVLFGVDLEIQRGELVALLGTNGAGKSTLLKAISGLHKPRRGTVELDGVDVTNVPAHKIAAQGVMQMPGGKGVFPTLTIENNLRLAQWLFRDDKQRTEEQLERVLNLFPILRERYGEMAGNMSGGEQQMLTLGMALMSDPKLLMIDELSLGLAPTIVGELIEVVHQIHETGVTMIIVEQSVNVALNLAERAVFMEKGEVRFEGATRDLLERPDILRSVFIAGASAGAGDDGGPTKAKEKVAKAAKQAEHVAPGPDAPLVLECVEVVKRFGGIRAVDGVNVALREGEILGLIGQNGAGKTTLFDCVSGFHKIDGGRILMRGTDVSTWEPHERAAARMGRSFQEAKLFPSLTTAETVAVALERHLANKDIVAAAFSLPASYESELAAAERVDELIELMGLSSFRQKFVGELSTGTRRIVELACMLAQDPDVLILDEPSGGVAQKETEALGPMLKRVQEYTGCSILIIEHDMPLMAFLCDRIYCLELGQVIAEGTPEEVLNDPRVIESYLGTDESAIFRSGSEGAKKPRRKAAASRTGSRRSPRVARPRS
ncbi:MAG TPA: ATP-binding cassette domain-containing protein [Acidimicrobiia bacterium]|nr:ATP-binding cassette domain-containing protein [Acidimicrobiia bacterium]